MTGARHPGVLDHLDQAIVVLVAALLAGSALTLGFLGLRIRAVEPGLDVVIDTMTTVVTVSVAVLAWARYRERGEPVAIFQAAAFAVAAVANAFSLLIVLGQLDADLDVAVALPGEGALYVSTVARFATAALLVVGGLASMHRIAMRWQRIAFLGAGVAVLATIVVAHGWGDALPPLSDQFVFASPGDAPTPASALPGSTPLGALVQTAVAVLFLWAVLLLRRLYRRDRAIGDAYVAAGLVFAAFSQLHLAIYPGTYPGLVTSGDLLRLAFDVVLLAGVLAEALTTLRTLRVANVRLEQLKDAEAERAALEERARLSRELHDGLAQDLWLAKLKAGRLATLGDLGPEAAVLSAELASAVEAGLADARQAVMALRAPADGEHASLCDLLHRYVDDFTDRFGLRAEYECDGNVPRLNSRAEAELLRIAQEALTNARRHADATLVRVQVGQREGRLVLAIRDNGHGFDPGAPSTGGFGLANMRERVGLIAGSLSIDSRPSGGTLVLVEVPIDAAGSVTPHARTAPTTS